MRKITLLLTFLISFATVCIAQDKAGTAGMTFLKMDVTARVAGLGGAYIGLSDDASSLFYNPAGLINLKNIEIIASHNSWLADVQYSYLGFTYPIPALNAGAGVQIGYLTAGEMNETDWNNPFGTGRTFGASGMYMGLSYAQMLTPKFFVGGTVKLIRENLADESVFAGAGDVGTYYDTGWESLVFGMSIRNFGTNYTYLKEDTPLPMLFVFGASWTPISDDENKLVVLLEAAHPSDNAEYVTIGCEYSYNNMFFARFGRKIDNDEYWLLKDDGLNFADNENPEDPELKYSDSGINWMGTSLGLGFYMETLGMKLDYAWKHMGYLGITHMITFGYELK